MLGLVPVGSAPIGTLSLTTRNTVNRDVTINDWKASVGTVLADVLDEEVADNGDYVYSSNQYDRQRPLVMQLSQALEAGVYDFDFTAQKDMRVGEIRLSLLDSSLVSVGISDWAVLLDKEFAQYKLTATSTGTASYVKIETRTDNYLALDFTDPDNVDSRVYDDRSSAYQPPYVGGQLMTKDGRLLPLQRNLYGDSDNLAVILTATNTTIESNAFYSPYNTLKAAKVTENSTNAAHSVGKIAGFTLNAKFVYTRSIYIKPNGRTLVKIIDNTGVEQSAIFNLTGNGTISNSTNLITSSIQILENGWYRCTTTWERGSSGSTTFSLELRTSTSTSTYQGNGINGVYIWGSQLQPGYIATKYVTQANPSDSGYAWKIEYSTTDYKFLSQELNSTASFAATPDLWYGAGAPSTRKPVGTELEVTYAGTGTNYVSTQKSSLGFTHVPGRIYLFNTIQRRGTGGNQFHRMFNDISGSTGYVTSTTDTEGNLLVIPRSTIGYDFYVDVTQTGQTSYLKKFSARQVELLPLGYKSEMYTVNEFLYSTDLTNAAWISTEIESIVSSTLLSPSGNYDAFRITGSATFGTHYVSQDITITSTATPCIFSVYATGVVGLRIDNAFGGYWANFGVGYGITPSVGTKDATSVATVQYIGNGWSRCAIMFYPTTIGTCTVSLSYARSDWSRDTGSSSPAFHIYGPQFEKVNKDQFSERGYPAAYIPTTTARAGNVNSSLGILTSNFYTGDPYTLYIEFGKLGRKGGTLIELIDASNNSIFWVYIDTSSKVGLAGPILTSTNTVNLDGFNSLAVRVEPGNYAVVLNGVITKSTVTTALGSTPFRMSIGTSRFNSGQHYGYTRKVRYYPRALSDGELLQLAGSDSDQNAPINTLITSW